MSRPDTTGFRRRLKMTIGEICEEAVERDATDIHLTVDKPPMFRLQKELTVSDFKPLTDDDMKILIYSMLRESQQKRLEVEREIDFSYEHGKHRFRGNAFWQRGHLAVALRIIPSEVPHLGNLGFPKIIFDLARKSRGLVMVTGPAGVGKSTTLAAMVDLINNERRCHIITIEDPIEYVHKDKKSIISQRELGIDTHSFANALKYALRQDPDVILVGEMRDVETIGLALTSAETGHLVLATLHTLDAAQTANRIIDVFPPEQQQQVRAQLAGSLQGIISQQLLPRQDGRGLVVACEILVNTSAVSTLIRDGKTHQLLNAMQTGRTYGMQIMDEALKERYQEGLISYTTALAKASNPENLKQIL